MRRTQPLLSQGWKLGRANLIQIRDATFYKEHPSANNDSSTNPPLFPNLTFDLPATVDDGQSERQDQHWAVVGAADGTTFLEVLRGSYLCFPPTARTYPWLASDEIARKDHRLRVPSRAIQYVGFNSKQTSGSVRGAYLSARYESRREETDWSVLQYLKGETSLNTATEKVDSSLLDRVVADLRLQNLLGMPVGNLSNGQTRRARIAKALLGEPELLLLDEPFMGLDPPTLVSLSPLLQKLAYRSSPLLLFGLRPQDPIPHWITHLVVLGHHHTVALMGRKAPVLSSVRRWAEIVTSQSSSVADQIRRKYGPPPSGVGDELGESGIATHPAFVSGSEEEWRQEVSDKATGQKGLDEWLELVTPSGNTSTPARPPSTVSPAVEPPAARPLGSPLIELESVVVRYGDKVVLGHGGAGLDVTVRRGTRLALLGPNGSGKTTFLSLLTSDHPQSYSLPIKFFGRSRLPAPGRPGLSLWEIQSRIGHSSPEIHAFFPKHLSVRRVLESAWADTYAGKPVLTPARTQMVDTFLAWWEEELRQTAPLSRSDDLDWARDPHHTFGGLPFGVQRLSLLLRALVKQPDLVILDEAFSGLDADTRDKAMRWIEHGERPPGTEDSAEAEAETKYVGLTASQALVVVSHVREEIPPVVDEWVRLPGEDEALETGRGVEGGRTAPGHIRTQEGWMRVWGLA